MKVTDDMIIGAVRTLERFGNDRAGMSSHSMSAETLSDIFGITEATARSRLNALEKKDALRAVYYESGYDSRKLKHYRIQIRVE